MGWLREAVSDDQGLADMAYLVIGALALGALMALAYVLTMSTVSYIRCTQIVDVGQGVRSAIPCSYDPLPTGQAAGLIFAAFATLIGALAGYMAATRRAPAQPKPVAQPAVTTTTTTEVAPAAPAVKPKTKGTKR